MNVTEPVGATEVVFRNVAVSPTVVGAPTGIEIGAACVVIDGDVRRNGDDLVGVTATGRERVVLQHRPDSWRARNTCPRPVRSTDVENDAVPDPIAPGPVIPVEVVHVLFEYRVNVTLPVGAMNPRFPNVAVSPTVVAVPTVIEVGLATVVIDGLALTQFRLAGTAEWVGGFVHVGS